MSRLIVLFDGYCNLCDGFVSFVMQRDALQLFEFVPLQGEEGTALLNGAGLGGRDFDSVVFLEEGKVWLRSDAALRIFSYLDWPWNWLRWLRVFPLALRDAVYRLVARLRYRILGRKDSCELTRRVRVPRATQKSPSRRDG